MTQSQALDILKTGGNVFLTGEPGAGKTYVINQYIAWLYAAGLSVAVTASTGIASTHIGGMTIHSWSGLGIRDTLSPYDLDKIATNEKVSRRVKRAHTLIIDEVSMLDGKLLDMIDKIMRSIRQTEDAFGGLQVIFVGDFFQLPPVTRQGEVMSYAFMSEAWRKANPLVCYLTEQHRQDDDLFLGLLQSIRQDRVEEDHYTLLSEQTSISYENLEPTKLYTHNADVDTFNQNKLRELKGSQRAFKMAGQGSKVLVESLARNCLSPELLELKEEAMVMFTKNNFEKGYVNGTLGRIIDFDRKDGWPIVKTSDGRTIKAEPVAWEVVEDGKVRAAIEQVPLRLAWAITVHKSQGMSLDAAEIDLSRAFVYGQGYVALSRVRTLAGLKLSGMNPNALSVDPRVIAADKRFREESDSAESVFAEMSEEDLSQMHKRFVTAGGGKVPKAGEVKPLKAGELMEKESTTEITKRLLLQGMSVREVAKERKLVETTVWSHIEEMLEDGRLKWPDVTHLLPQEWDIIWPELKKAITVVTDEKLKPIFEHLGEKYDYDIIRLGRVYHRLSK